MICKVLAVRAVERARVQKYDCPHCGRVDVGIEKSDHMVLDVELHVATLQIGYSCLNCWEDWNLVWTWSYDEEMKVWKPVLSLIE